MAFLDLADDDRRLPETQAELYLGYPRGRLRQRREKNLPPHPAEVDQQTAYYRLGELRRYSRGLYALAGGEAKGAA
jgi:hypothetical protein